MAPTPRHLLLSAAAALALLLPTADLSAKPSTANPVAIKVISLRGGGELRVPLGALSSDVGIVISYGRPPGDRRKAIGAPVRFKLVGPRAHRRLLKPVTLVLPAIAGRATTIRTFSGGRWRLVPTTIYPSRGTIEAKLRHFSWYGDFFSNVADFVEESGNRFAQGFGEFQGTRAGQASCVASGKRTAQLPTWASFAGVNGANDVLRTCAQGEGEIVAVEIVNNRPYGVEIDFPVPVAWAWTESGFGLRELLKTAAIRGGIDGLYIPPVSRAAIGIPRGSWTSANFQSHLTPLAVFADMVDVALEQLGSANRRNNKSTIVHILNLLSADCSGSVLSLDATDSPGDLSRFAADNTDCMRTVLRLAYEQGKIDPQKVSPQRLGKWLSAVNVWSRLRLADKFLQTFTDAAVGLSTGGFSVNATPASTAPDTSGTVGTPATPKPTASGLSATAYEGGHVGVAFRVGWQAGRDPVTCHFLRDGVEVFTTQCGTSPSKQFFGVPAGTHAWSATVSDRFGVFSDPTNTVTLYNSGVVAPPPPPAPKPSASNLRAVVYGGGHVGIAYDVGWQAGRDPVTCHFFRDGVEVFTAQCGTSSSKQFFGVPAGTHSWYATVSDQFGVYSDPTNTVTVFSS